MSKTRLLLIEDNPGDVELTRQLIHKGAPAEFDLVFTERLNTAIHLLRNEPFDIVLLDLTLPDCTGLESLRHILEEGPNLPVVILTGQDSEEMAVRAVREGAQDFVLKGSFDARQFVFTLRSAMLRKETELALARRAFYDELTGLPTRALLQDRWNRIRNRQRRSGKWVGLLVLDLDNFKCINDTFGHVAGDHVLETLARRVGSVLRRGDTMARIGGDEFVVLLEDIRGIEDAELVARKIAEAMVEPIDHGADAIVAGASVGIAISHPNHPDELYDVVRRADLDMYHRKREKGAREMRLDRLVGIQNSSLI